VYVSLAPLELKADTIMPKVLFDIALELREGPVTSTVLFHAPVELSAGVTPISGADELPAPLELYSAAPPAPPPPPPPPLLPPGEPLNVPEFVLFVEFLSPVEFPGGGGGSFGCGFGLGFGSRVVIVVDRVMDLRCRW
jgi:hypothetical protein